MDQTTTASQGSDLEVLRLQLEEDGKYFYNQNSQEARDRLLHTLQTNDYREIISTAVDKSDLANVFVKVGVLGHVDLLEAFLHFGMHVDMKDQDGWTALICASWKGHEECVRLLLDHNASVDVRNDFNATALMYASQGSKTSIVEMLLEKNANPDLQNSIGTTALMLASDWNHREVIELLLNRGADIDLKNKKGQTALDLTKNKEIKELLQNHVSTSYVLK
jgi:ankyrin repeat protein